MKVDLVGKIKNTQLPRGKALLPLFEVVVNAFQAIEDNIGHPSSGRIEIVVHRDDVLAGLDVEGHVNGFSVTDTGIGFDETNLESFFTSDSQLKVGKGGKGLGRFSWLKAFAYADVESHYRRNGADACASGLPVHDGGGGEADYPSNALEGYASLHHHCPPCGDGRARTGGVPSGSRVDRPPTHRALSSVLYQIPSVRALLSLTTAGSATSTSTSRTRSLQMLRGTTWTSQAMRSNSRGCGSTTHTNSSTDCSTLPISVKSTLSVSTTFLPNLQKSRLEEEDGRKFVYLGFVEGQYLDENVNSERTAFVFPRERSADGLLDDISFLEAIRNAALVGVRSDLQPFLEEINAQKRETDNCVYLSGGA